MVSYAYYLIYRVTKVHPKNPIAQPSFYRLAINGLLCFISIIKSYVTELSSKN